MNEFVQFKPIPANQERARRFWEIRNRNEKNGIGKTEIVTLKAACAGAQTANRCTTSVISITE